MEEELPVKELSAAIWCEKDQSHASVQLACSYCMGLKFYVYQGDYYTAVACVDCNVVHGVHHG